MNKPFVYILVSGASALAGGIAGYFICRAQLKKQFDEEVAEAINKEIQNLREAKKEADETIGVGKEAVDEKPSVEAPPESYLKEGYVADVEQMINEKFPDVDLNPYRVKVIADKLMQCHNYGLTEEETMTELVEFLSLMGFLEPDDEDEGPNFNDIMDDYKGRTEVIPLSDYRNLPVTFEFVTFHYFEEDDILIDDKDMIVDDIFETVGDALNHFGEEEEDDDCVYLINGDYGLAIEIVRLHTSYAGWSGWGSIANG